MVEFKASQKEVDNLVQYFEDYPNLAENFAECKDSEEVVGIYTEALINNSGESIIRLIGTMLPMDVIGIAKAWLRGRIDPYEDTDNLTFNTNDSFIDYFSELEEQVKEFKELEKQAVELADLDCDCDCGVEEDVNPDPRFAAWERKFKTAFA